MRLRCGLIKIETQWVGWDWRWQTWHVNDGPIYSDSTLRFVLYSWFCGVQFTIFGWQGSIGIAIPPGGAHKRQNAYEHTKDELARVRSPQEVAQ